MRKVDKFTIHFKPFTMKKILMIFATAAVLASCQKQTVNPVAQEKAQNKTAARGTQSDYTTYCYTSTQTSIDSWTINVNQNLGGLSTVADYYIQYDLNGVTTAWIPVTSFPYGIGSGYGAAVTNIKIKETRCLTSPFGTRCTDTFYTVSHC